MKYNEVKKVDGDEQARVHRAIHEVLVDATERGSESVGCTGASFVIAGISMWCAELCELDAGAVSRMLRALATVYDPKSTPEQVRSAEEQRERAVLDLFKALDLLMAPGNWSA